MASDGRETVIEAWAANWSDPRRLDYLLGLFTNDCVYEDVTFGVVVRGLDALQAFAEGVFAAVPDFRVELVSCCVSGSLGAMEWVISGTHEGDFPGLPVTGKPFKIRGMSMVEFDGQRLRRCSDDWDAAAFMKQVGLLSAG